MERAAGEAAHVKGYQKNTLIAFDSVFDEFWLILVKTSQGSERFDQSSDQQRDTFVWGLQRKGGRGRLGCAGPRQQGVGRALDRDHAMPCCACIGTGLRIGCRASVSDCVSGIEISLRIRPRAGPARLPDACSLLVGR